MIDTVRRARRAVAEQAPGTSPTREQVAAGFVRARRAVRPAIAGDAAEQHAAWRDLVRARADPRLTLNMYGKRRFGRSCCIHERLDYRSDELDGLGEDDRVAKTLELGGA